MGKGWGFEQKEKHLVHFLWVGNWVQTSNIAKNPPHPPKAYTFHDECHEPDLTHLRYEAT